MTSFFQAASKDITFGKDPYFRAEETTRFRKDFPEGLESPIFLQGDGHKTYLSVLEGTLRRFGVELEKLDHVHVSSLAPALPAYFPLEVRNGKKVHIVVGPSQSDSFAQDFYLVPPATSSVSRAIWDRYVWDHEIAHFLLGDTAPASVSPENYSESVADSYALLRAWQRGEEALSLKEDIVTERSFLGLADFLHDTTSAIASTFELIRANPQKIKGASPQETLRIAREIGKSRADPLARVQLYEKTFGSLRLSKEQLVWDAAIESLRFCRLKTNVPDIAKKQTQFKRAVATMGARMGLENQDLAETLVSILKPPLDLERAAQALQTYTEVHAAYHEPESRALLRKKIQQEAQNTAAQRQRPQSSGSKLLFKIMGGENPDRKLDEDERTLMAGVPEKMARAFPGLLERLKTELGTIEQAMSFLKPDRRERFLDEALKDFQGKAIAQTKLPMREEAFSVLDKPGMAENKNAKLART